MAARLVGQPPECGTTGTAGRWVPTCSARILVLCENKIAGELPLSNEKPSPEFILPRIASKKINRKSAQIEQSPERGIVDAARAFHRHYGISAGVPLAFVANAPTSLGRYITRWRPRLRMRFFSPGDAARQWIGVYYSTVNAAKFFSPVIAAQPPTLPPCQLQTVVDRKSPLLEFLIGGVVTPEVLRRSCRRSRSCYLTASTGVPHPSPSLYRRCYWRSMTSRRKLYLQTLTSSLLEFLTEPLSHRRRWVRQKLFAEVAGIPHSSPVSLSFELLEAGAS
nr:hypothetical protein Iba_scaffold29866CG0010 [Ipomoea batatas]GMC80617.1 hypothetical protein Iba_chr04aCG22010 [Ipomoea batatas]